MRKISQLSMSLFCIVLLLMLSCSCLAQSKKIQQDVETTAEISASIDDAVIPGIQKNWTAINLTVMDNFGINWTLILELSKQFPYNLYWKNWFFQTYWVYVYRVPKGLLGYTAIKFVPEYPTGWAVKVIPSAVNGTTSGMQHKITVYAEVNELASNYSPLIRIKCIRYDAMGAEYGSSYINLPLKAVQLNFAYVQPTEPTKKAPPHSVVSFPIQVTNKGEYRNTFQFNVTGQSGTYGLVAQQSLTLDPGEMRTVQLMVSTPEVFYDIGTPRRIDVSVYPLGNPSQKFDLSVIVITEGFYITPLITIPLAIIIILVIIIYFLFFYPFAQAHLGANDIIDVANDEARDLKTIPILYGTRGTTIWVLTFTLLHVVGAALFIGVVGRIAKFGIAAGVVLLLVANVMIMRGKTPQPGSRPYRSSTSRCSFTP